MSNSSMSVSADNFVSDDVLLVYRRVVVACLWPVIVLAGVISNVINIIIFIHIKPLDSVGISFLALSLTHMSHLCLIAFHVWGDIFYLTFPTSHVGLVAPSAFYMVFYWYAYIFYDSSAFITAFIAIARCCIVAIPFHFKNVFTQSRTVVVLCTLVAISVLLRLPMLLIHRLVVLNDTHTNLMLLREEETGDKAGTYAISDIVNGNVIPLTSFLIVLSCLVVLTSKLRAATRFRRACTPSTLTCTIRSAHGKKTREIKTPHQTMTLKELQVVRSVALVSTVYIVLSAPFMLYSLARRIQPEFTVTGRFSNLFAVITIFSRTCAYINDSVNTILYYTCNTKFRKAFNELILRRSR